MRIINVFILFLLCQLVILTLGARPPTKPTRRPTKKPTKHPTGAPTGTLSPTTTPPSRAPTRSPTKRPTNRPSRSPTVRPSHSPSRSPTTSPSASPTVPFEGYFFSLSITNANLSTVVPIFPTSAPTMATLEPTTSSPTFMPTTNSPTRPTTNSPTKKSSGGAALRDSGGRVLQTVPRMTTAVPTSLKNLSGRWFRLRESLHCLVDFVLDIKDVDLLANRLFLQVALVPSGCNDTIVSNATSCFPMTVAVGVDPKDTLKLGAWKPRNVSVFLTTVNRFLTPLSNFGTVVASQELAKPGVHTFPGDQYTDAFGFERLGTTPSGCRDIYLDQEVRAQIEARKPTDSPTFLTDEAPTASNSTGDSNAVGLGVGLTFGLFLPLIVLGYFCWVRREQVKAYMESQGWKVPLLPVDPEAGGSHSGSLPIVMKKGTRYNDSISSTSFPSAQLLGTNASGIAGAGDFEFAIDLSKLKLGKVIGSGANGRIFSARYMGSDVAVKELFAYQTTEDDDPESVKNSPASVIKREFDNLRRLKHPHVIQLFGLAYARSAETGSPRYLLVMELAHTSLDKLLNKKMQEFENGSISANPAATLTMSSVSTEKMPTHTSSADFSIASPSAASIGSKGGVSGLPPPPIHPMTNNGHFLWAMDIARQISSGLAFVHGRGLIHFDVKPHNILLDKAGIVKLCDLGISKMVNKQSDLTLTSPGRAGTPSYMAPELLRADMKLIGTKVDVYAFAIVLWQLLHLRPPHPKEWSIAQLFDAVLHHNHRPAIDSLTDERTSALINRCWSESPADRPDFPEISREIDAIVEAAKPQENEEDTLLDGEKLILEEATFIEGDKVQVFSQAVGLVHGVVKAISLEGDKKFYDVLLSDNSMMIGLSAAEMIPLKKTSPGPGGEVKKRPMQLEVLDKNATIADLAAALAIARADERRRGRGGRRSSVVESGINSVFPHLAGSMRSSVTNSPKGARMAANSQSSMLRFGKKMWRSRDQPSPSFRDDGLLNLEPPRTPPTNGPSSPTSLAMDIAKSNAMNMPALTPFSLRFLRGEDDTSTGMQTGTQTGLEEASMGNLAQTFRYNGAVLEMKGLLVSEGGLRSSGNQRTPGPIAEEPTPGGTKYTSKLFKIAELGHGASGNVHSALHEETFEIVAVKEVKFLSDRAARHQTVRELKALQSLRHPNVVEFRAAFLDPVTECVCIVLEYVLGGSLQDLIEMSSTPPSSSVASPAVRSPLASIGNFVNEESLRRIAYDLCSALEYCHANLIAHLDVKPSNVLLTASGSAKLADFGLARTFNEASNVHAATFVGTTKYMSPERLKGENYSFPADIWGLGLSLGAAALGKFPIDLQTKGGDSAVFFSLLEKLSATNNKLIHFPPDRFSPEAIKFIESCLALNPADRPTASQLLSDFEWMKDVPEQPENRDKTANRILMREIAEAVAQRLVEIESRATVSKVIEVQPSLISNLAKQLNLEEQDIRVEFETALARLTNVQSSLLSDTMTSRSSRESRNSRFAHSDAGTPLRKQASEPLSDTINSLLSMPNLKSPSMTSVASFGAARKDNQPLMSQQEDDDNNSGEGLELHPL